MLQDFEIAQQLNTTKLVRRLYNFYCQSWEGSEGRCKYRVYLAQKGLNLNELFFRQAIENAKKAGKMREVDRLTRVRNETVISQTGILMKADELVSYYIDNDCFPGIWIYDELCVNGHDYSELICSLEDAVCSAWEMQQRKRLDNSEYWHLRQRLFEALQLHVFLQDNKGLLVDGYASERVRSVEKVYSYAWFPFAQEITKLLTGSPFIENTFYIPTFRLNQIQFQALRESLERNKAWRSSLNQYFPNAPEALLWHRDETAIDQTIRLHYTLYCKKLSEEGLICVTPYVLLAGPISDDAMQELFELLDKELSAAGLHQLAKVFASYNEAMVAVKLQLVSALSSMLLFFHLWDRCNAGTFTPRDLRDNTDIEKTCQCFGTIEEVFPEFQKLCAIDAQALRDRIFAEMRNVFLTEAPAMCVSGRDSGDQELSAYVRHARDYYLELERQKAKEIRMRRQENIIYSHRTNFVDRRGGGLQHYLASFDPNFTSLDQKLGVLISMMQNGFISQCVCAPEEAAYYLNVGESSLAMAFQEEEATTLPALIRLESYCRQNGLNTVTEIADFGKYLQRNNLAEYGITDRLVSFTELIYDSGFLLRYWPWQEAESLEQRQYIGWLDEYLKGQNIRSYPSSIQ